MRAVAILALMMAGAGTAAAGAPAHGRASAVSSGAGQVLAPDAPLPSVLRQASTYRLWPGRAPGATSDSPSQTPTLTCIPAKARGINITRRFPRPINQAGGAIQASPVKVLEQLGAWMHAYGASVYAPAAAPAASPVDSDRTSSLTANSIDDSVAALIKVRFN